MEWKELVRNRYSCRAYMDMPVPDEKIEDVLNDVRMAPSAANRQPVRIFIIRKPEIKKALREAYDKEWFYKAPVIIAVCGNQEECWKRSFDGKDSLDIDTAIAMDHLTLAAANLGLGTCWICAFKPDVVKRVLKLPANVVPVALSPLGYPDDQPKPKKRKEVKQIARFL